MGRVRRGVRLVGRLLLRRVGRCRGGLRMKRGGWGGKWWGSGWTKQRCRSCLCLAASTQFGSFGRLVVV